MLDVNYKINIFLIIVCQNKIAFLSNNKKVPSALPRFDFDKKRQSDDVIDEYIKKTLKILNYQKVITIFSFKQDSAQVVNLIYRVNLPRWLHGICEKNLSHGFVWLDADDKDKLQDITDNLSRRITDWVFGWYDSQKSLAERPYIIYSDGASRGNPGHSAAAYVIYDAHGMAVVSGGEYLGITTSTVAEYYAVKLSLEAALEMGVKALECRVDSLSVVNQINGTYDVKNRDIWPIYERIAELMKKFRLVKIVHVSREQNQEADNLANELLDNYSK